MSYPRRNKVSYDRSVQGKLKAYSLVTWNMCDLYVMAAYTQILYIDGGQNKLHVYHYILIVGTQLSVYSCYLDLYIFCF